MDWDLTQKELYHVLCDAYHQTSLPENALAMTKLAIELEGIDETLITDK